MENLPPDKPLEESRLSSLMQAALSYLIMKFAGPILEAETKISDAFRRQQDR